jgi:DNA ligase-1
MGKMLTVRFQNLTNTGVPRFPIGLVVRDYE